MMYKISREQIYIDLLCFIGILYAVNIVLFIMFIILYWIIPPIM